MMEYDVKLKHKPGKQMIPADALSRQHDHAIGLKDDVEDITGLPEDLFIKLVDVELRDAVAKGQESDEAAREVLRWIQDPANLTTKWSMVEAPNAPKCLFYDGRLYVPDDLALHRKIVTDHHDTAVAGHPGTLATTRSVRLSYYWPGLPSFV